MHTFISSRKISTLPSLQSFPKTVFQKASTESSGAIAEDDADSSINLSSASNMNCAVGYRYFLSQRAFMMKDVHAYKASKGRYDTMRTAPVTVKSLQPYSLGNEVQKVCHSFSQEGRLITADAHAFTVNKLCHARPAQTICCCQPP